MSKKMTKLPAMPFYVGDWRKDPGVQALDYRYKGIWFEMICIMWEMKDRGKLSFNGKKMSEETLANILKLDKDEVNHLVGILLEYDMLKVEESTNILYSKRMVEDEILREKRRIAGKKGGNPYLLKPIVNHEVEQDTKPIDNQIVENENESVTEDEFKELWFVYPGLSKNKGSKKIALEILQRNDFKFTFEEIKKSFVIYGKESDEVKRGVIMHMKTFLRGGFVKQWLEYKPEKDQEQISKSKGYKMQCPECERIHDVSEKLVDKATCKICEIHLRLKE